MAEGGEGEDEIQFLRTDDEVVLQCSATIHKEQQKLCLAAEGFGNRLCFLESISNSKLGSTVLSMASSSTMSRS
ncbi:Ryanodine receptor 2 [Larimichthys crocea]|uniref:Uncharacterized protein n=1 Tax=Larimichthys crocea TaxID=215358 RepID=A0ACD3RTI5_LARCR|nr:Ryanodine receptor 2 [Larimichthys crocea]